MLYTHLNDDGGRSNMCLCMWFVCACVCVCVFNHLLVLHDNIFTTLSTRTKSNTKLYLKRISAGLNLDLSFSWRGCHTKVKLPGLSYYVSQAGGKNNLINTFHKIISTMLNAERLFQDLNSDHRLFSKTITVKQQAPPKLHGK